MVLAGSTRLWQRLAILTMLFLLTASCGRPFHPTPLDALTEFPGHLSQANLGTAQVLRQEPIAGGLVMLYRHPGRPGATCAQEQLTGTFVTPAGQGWRAQSSGWCCLSESDEFAACGIAGGNVTDLTTAFGWSAHGSAARIEWEDGQWNEVRLDANGTFLVSRPEMVSIHRVELLGEQGNVLESRVW